MTDLIPFTFDDHPVRVLHRDDQPWFVLADVCRVLEIGNSRDAASRLDDDEKNTVDITDGIHAARGNPNVTIINESGLYSLILTSRKPAARRFKKWVTAEVLPAIRRTGSYSVTPAARPAPRIALTDGDFRKLPLIREVRCTFGPLAAQRFWRDIGMPEVNVTANDNPMAVAEEWGRMVAGGLSASAIASAAGITDRAVQYGLRMLERLIEPAKQAVRDGRLNPTQAREMSAATPARQEAILAVILSGRALRAEDIALLVKGA